MADRSLSEFLRMPEEVTKGNTLITVFERSTVTIDNYKGLLLYDPCEIIVKANRCHVKVCGVNLNIDYFTKNDIQISGSINKIEWS